MSTFNIKEELSLAARLEMIAEEASELSQAALKFARYYRGENPVCRTEKELTDAITEELSDLLVAVAATDYRPNWDIVAKKKQRWQERMAKREEENYDRFEGIEE